MVRLLLQNIPAPAYNLSGNHDFHCRETLILLASSSCDQPFFLRSLIILSAKIMKTPRLKTHKLANLIVPSLYFKARLHTTSRKLSMRQPTVAFSLI